MEKKKLVRRPFALMTLTSIACAAAYAADTTTPAGKGQAPASTAAPAGSAAAQQGAVPPTTPGNNADTKSPPKVTGILGLCDDKGNAIDGKSSSEVGLNDLLWVVLKTTADRLDSEAQRLKRIQELCKKPDLQPVAASKDASSKDKQVGAPPQTSPSRDKDAEPASQATPPTDAKLPALDASAYALFFDGREVPGLDSAVYNDAHQALGFLLTRNANNKAVWGRALGSPTSSHRTVTVALGVRERDKTTQVSIEGEGSNATFQLEIFECLWLWIAGASVGLVLVLVVGTARTTTTLRDDLLPQLPATEQPYSLARCQMAFWFVLIFTAFIFLYVMLWDYNTVSPQALALMGIASGTALAAVAVDILKDSPADMANRALRALGLNTYDDVLRVEQEIAGLKPQVPAAQVKARMARSAAEASQTASDAMAANPAASADQKAGAAKTAKDAADLADAADREMTQLNAAIQDREIVIRTYQDKSRPFRSECFFKDITTDLNGPTVHRLQVVFWTLALGGVFIVGVYRDLAMPPDFSPTLLALMGLSGASYVGFKYPEKNN